MIQTDVQQVPRFLCKLRTHYLDTDTSEGNNFLVLGSLEDQKTLKSYYDYIYFKSMRLFRAEISPAKK